MAEQITVPGDEGQQPEPAVGAQPSGQPSQASPGWSPSAGSVTSGLAGPGHLAGSPEPAAAPGQLGELGQAADVTAPGTGTMGAAIKGWRMPGSCGAGAAVTRLRGSIRVGVAIIAVVASVSSCGGSAAKSQTPITSSSARTPAQSARTSASPSAGVANGVPAVSLPAGYRWVGSTARGVWFAVPRDWAAVDLAKVNVTQAISRIGIKGMSSSSVMKTTLNELSQQHPIFAADLASAVRSPYGFATNVNAFCESSPVAPDASSLPALKAAARAQYAQFGWHVLALRAATVDGDVGIESKFTITSASGVTLTDTQYIVLTKSSRACTITLSTDDPAPFQRIFRKIGGTIRVS